MEVFKRRSSAIVAAVAVLVAAGALKPSRRRRNRHRRIALSLSSPARMPMDADECHALSTLLRFRLSSFF